LSRLPQKNLDDDLFYNAKMPENPFKQCINCRQRYKTTKQNKRKVRENIDDNCIQIDPKEISDHLFELLTDLSPTNDFYDVNNIQFTTKFVINLEWLIEKLSTDDSLMLSKSIIKFIEDGDGFSYVYKSKDGHKNGTISYVFWCNCRQELARRPNKHVDESKRRDTANYLIRYDCKGFVDVNLDFTNGFAYVKIKHYLHNRPETHTVTKEIKDYMAQNSDKSVPDLYSSIKSLELNGYEHITVKQVYFWWNKQFENLYKEHDNEQISVRIYLSK
jgi:hypothetical protein